VDYGTLRRYQHEGRLHTIDVCGVPHHVECVALLARD
jgi:hypothetical protein